MKNNSKITVYHLKKNAYIYIRQSTERQVRENIESKQRQYELQELAQQYGWSENSIIIIDDDLGQTATTRAGRNGFDKLVADIILKKVGIIWGIEVSRLTRNNKDWYQLLDFCSLTNTLIADTDGIYDPALFNDRLLLGLKGTMSEAEVHMLKNRMLQGSYHKAQKGELRFHLPAGYQFDEQGNIIKSLDEQIRHIIELTYKKFFELGTVNGVLQYLLEQQLLFPRNVITEKKIQWVRPYHKAIRKSLGNPLYTGTYVFGRTKVVKELDENGNQISRQKKQDMKDWDVIIHNHHPAYITWDQYLKIEDQIAKNTAPIKFETTQAIREGSALLQGLVRCGKCGRSMHINYHGSSNKSYPFYNCNVANRYFGKGYCQSIGGRRIDQTVTEIFLEAISPASLSIQLQALQQIQNREDTTLKQLRLQFEKAQYECDRTFRQFDAVEPENRLVARTLEKQWNDALNRAQEANAQLTEREKMFNNQLSKIDEKEMCRLAKNLPELWNVATTTDKDRKKLFRAAIQEVQLNKIDRDVTVKVIWIGGAVFKKTVHLHKIRSKRYTSLDVVELIRQLAHKFTDAQIARILIRKRVKTATGLSFNGHRVASLRSKYNIRCYKEIKNGNQKSYNAQQAADILRISVPTVHKWINEGFIKAEQVTSGAPWEIVLTDEDIKRLTADETPDGWLSVELAAKELTVTRQTILNWIKSQKLEYIYVTKGRKKGLRVNIQPVKNRKQMSFSLNVNSKI